MREFLILHNDTASAFTEEVIAERKFAGIVMAESIEDALLKSQNENGEYATGWTPTRNRSTTIGDVIVDNEAETPFLVIGGGFKAIKYSEITIGGSINVPG